ncbi:aromatic amino acid lyase, partial [Streptomyces sp. ME02-6978.2a]
MSTTADEPTRAPSTEGARVVLDGAGLDVGGVVRLADNDAVPEVTGEALARVRHAWETAERLAARGRLYGRGTGVGAHRQVAVEEDELAGHGLRLLRSHAGGAGAVLPARQARAMLAVRTNQLLAGGSGIHPDFVEALAEALRLGVHPALTEYGSVGTGDLTALAQTGLTLLGEQPWLGGTREAPGPEAGLPRPAAPAREPGRPAPDRAAGEPRPRERHGASGLPSETPRPPRGTDVPALPGGTGTRVAAPCTDGSPIPVPRRPRSGTGVPRPSAAPAG